LIGEALTATRAFLARREPRSPKGLWSAHRASILPSRLALRLEKEPPGSAAFERGWRAALAYVLRREHLRRTVRIALLVGIVLTTVNQLDAIVRVFSKSCSSTFPREGDVLQRPRYALEVHQPFAL